MNVIIKRRGDDWVLRMAESGHVLARFDSYEAARFWCKQLGYSIVAVQRWPWQK